MTGTSVPPAAGGPPPPGGGIPTRRPAGQGPQGGDGASADERAAAGRHPDAIQWAQPQLSPALRRLRGLFDADRLLDAAATVADDHARHSPAELGRAFGARLLSALFGQDDATLMRVLGLDPDEQDLASQDRAVRREMLEAMASAKAGALAQELARDAAELTPAVPQPPHVSGTDGTPAGDLALVLDGLAALCAAHGYAPDAVFDGALTSPLDIPGALHLPAYPLQIMFAYTDGRGLGPYLERAILSPFSSPGETAAAAQPVLAYATA